MRRRALLAGLAGGTAALAGCNAVLGPTDDRRDVYNPTGRAVVRPLDEPLVRHGLTGDAGQYVFAALFGPGDTLPVTDDPDAAWLSGAVADLSAGQFAVLTGLRTAGTAPAHFWPADTRWAEEAGRLRVELERRSFSDDEAAEEVVGVALTVYEHDGDPPAAVDVVFPSGATLAVGSLE